MMTGYSGGRIMKIRVHNFMTYDDVELYPKKGLNLIVGLNGSGKSSIMCAICLGLAGKPHFTGRATQLSRFIKHGHHEAAIEIELESVSRKNVVIQRKLKGDKCEWSLNNSPSNQNEVASVVKKFNIDTSNLCQFLPQEKVTEFSKMDKKQRLENMLQAIGEPHLFHLFNELKALFKNLTELEQTVKKHQNNKSAAEEENDKISDEVQKQEGRVRLKKELDILHKQKKIVIYQQIKAEVDGVLKVKKKELEEEAQILRRERNEAKEQEDFIVNSYQNCNKRFQQLDSCKKNIKTEMNDITNALINFKEQVETSKIDYKNRLKEKEDQEKRFHDINKQVEGLRRQISEESQMEGEYNEQEQLKSQDLAKLQIDINELYQSMDSTSTEKNSIQYQLKNLENELHSLQNEQNKKMANLQRVCKHAHQAATWLLENRHLFRSNVFLPMMFEININSQNYAKYIENVISFNDMIAFVCEDKKDCELLAEIFKKKHKLSVNIVMAPDTPMSMYASPTLSREHSQCGLKSFVTDLFNAPEPIMKYLCACYHIHRIPLATSVIPAKNVNFILRDYPIFFSENMMFTGKRSRYGNRNMYVKKDFIVDKNLLVNSNDEFLRDVEQRYQNCEKQRDDKNRRLEVLKAHLAEKEKIQDKLRQEKKMLQEKKKTIENLRSKCRQKEQYLKQLRPVSNEEEEKIKMTKKILSINEGRKSALANLDVLFKKFIQAEKDIVTLIMSMNIYSRDLKLARSANEDIHERVKAIEIELDKITREYREKKAYAKDYCKRLIPELQLMGEEYIKYWKGPSVVSIELTMDDIEQKINHIQAQLNLNEDNDFLVNEYNDRKKKIQAIQQNIKNFEQDVDRLKQKLQKKKNEWIQPLLNHIGNINRKFSQYFRELNCVGEISLDVPENTDDFTQYGLRISLKFRDGNLPLMELSGTHHSGGECSVAAIVFILSLQELTEVPFRCIDEINQGMDSENERKIYQLISDSVADNMCSQYFLLTPKLLMDLDYPEGAAVHIIFNSPFLQSKLDIKEHLAIAQSA